MRIPIRWHAEARRLRADGKTPVEIAKTLSRPLSTVRWALNESGGEQNRERIPRARARRLIVDPDMARAMLDADIGKVIVPLFLEGEIDRAELTRRITV